MGRAGSPAGPSTKTTMLKTISLSAAFFLTLGLLFAAYASVPV